MPTKERNKRGKPGAGDDSTAKRLDAILDVLKTLLIIEGHDAGITKAKVRAMAKAADARVSQVWRELEAARKAREKAAAKAKKK